MKRNYKQKLHRVKALVFDMDGTLTTGVFQIGSDGKPMRNLNSKDGYALQLAIKKGYVVSVISGGHCPGIKESLQRLGLSDIYMQAAVKKEAWEDLLATYAFMDLQAEQCLYMGDDIPDYPLLQEAGLACVPHNGVAEVRAIADYVSPYEGGQGCVRDVIEQTLKAQKNWMLDEDFSW